jgi:hypothetical protein
VVCGLAASRAIGGKGVPQPPDVNSGSPVPLEISARMEVRAEGEICAVISKDSCYVVRRKAKYSPSTSSIPGLHTCGLWRIPCTRLLGNSRLGVVILVTSFGLRGLGPRGQLSASIHRGFKFLSRQPLNQKISKLQHCRNRVFRTFAHPSVGGRSSQASARAKILLSFSKMKSYK